MLTLTRLLPSGYVLRVSRETRDRERTAPTTDGETDVIDLSGGWHLREAIGETWRWHVGASAAGSLNSVPEAATTDGGWIEAAVPGSVIDALHSAGVVDDPRRGWGSRAVEWTANRSWVLRRIVDVPAAWVDEEVTLEVDGVDPGGRVWWNGVETGVVEGMYRPAAITVPVTRPGPQLMAVVVDRAPRGVPQVGRTQDVERHAPRLGAGWDFCPPFPHQGIWRPLRLRRGPRMSAVVVSVMCDGVEGGSGSVRIDVEIASGAGAGMPLRARLDRAGRDLIEAETIPDGAHAQIELSVDDVALWWPNGHGAQPLADLTIAWGGHRVHRRVGFRSLQAEHSPGAPREAEQYGLLVNGERIPLVGFNWAPTDAQYGSITPARLQHLLDLAQAAGARLLRVWGGGLIETEEFYDACDERGLLVWQEFSQSSSGFQSAPSDDPAFLRALAADAEALVPARRHHASLALWGGGNELEDEAGPLSTERSPALRALRSVVARRDPGRPWLPTSPSGPVFHHRLDEIERAPEAQHDVHGPWEHQGLEEHYTLGNAGTALAHTEFGVEGMANARIFDRTVPEPLRWPADRANPLHRHLGEWWNNAEQVSRMFGGGLLDDPPPAGVTARLHVLRRASQWLQATGLAYSVESDRRRWPRTSLVLPWQLAESYPNTWGTALVDFAGEPKPAFHAVARAFRDERATIRLERSAWGGHSCAHAEIWLWSLAGRPAGGVLEVGALAMDGTPLVVDTVELDAVDVPRAAARVRVPTPTGPFLWRCRWWDVSGTAVDDEIVVATGDDSWAGLLDAHETTLSVTRLGPTALSIRNTGASAAVGWAVRDARAEHDASPRAWAGDPRPLLPGQRRRVDLLAGAADGDLMVDAINAPPRRRGRLRDDLRRGDGAVLGI